MSRKGVLQVQVTVPTYFLCPISLELMRDPVTLSSGQTFDRASIQQWLDEGHNTCPVTRQPIDHPDLQDPIPNHALRRMIQSWCVQNKSCGVERILTPRQPPSLKDIPLLLDQLLAPSSLSSSSDSLDALQKLTRLALDRPSRSRKSILLSGALPSLAKLLSRSFAPLASVVPTPISLTLVDEALKLLDLLIDPELYGDLDLQQLNCHEEELIMSLVNTLLRTGIADSRLRAASVLSRLQPPDCLKRKMGEMQGFIVALVDMIREDDVSANTALELLVNVCAASNRNRVSATEAGAVGALGELLVSVERHGGDKVTTEALLRALDVLCQCAEGRAAVAAEASILTAVVKQMNTVSERAAHHAIHIVFLVVKWAPDAAKLKSSALQDGALVKAIAVAQSAAASETRLAARRLAASLSEALPNSHLVHTMRLL